MIVVFGDSIAFGMNDIKGGYVNRLKKDFEIINKSIPGETSSGILKRIKKNLENLSPDIIMIAIGANDSTLVLKKNRVPLLVFKKNYKKIIKISKEHSKKIICLGITCVDESKMNPRTFRRYVSSTNSTIEKYNLAIKEIAKEEKLIYVHLQDLLKDDDLSDGLHPNSVGHEKLYEKLKKELLNLSKS